MTLEIHPGARRELNNAVTYYEERSTGLGYGFAEAFEHAVDLIEAHPLAGAPHPTRSAVRLWPIDGFPYRVVYAYTGGSGAVYAVAHDSRAPDYWVSRLS